MQGIHKQSIAPLHCRKVSLSVTKWVNSLLWYHSERPEIIVIRVVRFPLLWQRAFHWEWAVKSPSYLDTLSSADPHVGLKAVKAELKLFWVNLGYSVHNVHEVTTGMSAGASPYCSTVASMSWSLSLAHTATTRCRSETMFTWRYWLCLPIWITSSPTLSGSYHVTSTGMVVNSVGLPLVFSGTSWLELMNASMSMRASFKFNGDLITRFIMRNVEPVCHLDNTFF